MNDLLKIINLNKQRDLTLMEIFFLITLGLILAFVFNENSSRITTFFRFKLNDDLNNLAILIFFTLIWVFTFLFLKDVFFNLKKFLNSSRSYVFTSADWPDEWLYQGGIKLITNEQDTLCITDSNSGCILKDRYWSNFELKFECKFLRDTDNPQNDNPILGIILRAESLSNYLMVQINNKKKEEKITPHVRAWGVWETIDGPKLTQKLEKGIYHKVVLRVRNKTVELFINGNLELSWILPTNTDIADPHGVSDIDKEKRKNSFVPAIEFSSKSGMIGFRAYSNELAYVRKIKIRGI